MILKIRNEPDGRTCVWVVDPSQNAPAGETVEGSTHYLDAGQEIPVTLSEVHSIDGISFGTVTGGADEGKPDAAATDETAGETTGETGEEPAEGGDGTDAEETETGEADSGTGSDESDSSEQHAE